MISTQILRVGYSRVFGVGDLKHATQNFKGAKGVAMVTKFVVTCEATRFDSSSNRTSDSGFDSY